MSRTNRWIVVSVVLALVVLLLAPFVYTELSEGRTPPPLGLQTSAEPSPEVEKPEPGPFDVDGRWSVGPGSAAGFRATLEDAPADERTVVASTDDVAGWVEVADGEATAARVEVRTATLTTGSPVQDRVLRRALEVDVFPTAVFTLTSPLDVARVEETDEPVDLEARGTLTILGETQPVTVALEAQRSGEGVQLRGAIGVRFSDYGVVLPSEGPVQVEDQGTVEMRLALTRSAP
ncbi:YceI family protein [Cellulosimicrobium cellulans]|uniref:YceI family protein n=1 Tax=Cellulosimicrobium cellulans TaxID=1710 RepID=UPI000849327F|nr:YceI family protein [Cellulosimicrobium cellulans]